MLESTLLYNPAAGRDRERRAAISEAAAAILRSRGFAVQIEPTRAKGTATRQASDAVQRGSAAVFACGGDGTVHEVLQGVAGTGALLGVLPAGSANALAQELKIPPDPLRAAACLSPEESVALTTTRVQRSGVRPLYSLCMAGAGPDGLLMYRMLAVNRSRFGRWRYYEHALRIFLSHRFAPFRVELEGCSGTRTEHEVVSAMALRIGDLQGIFSGIARGASVHDKQLHVVLVRPPARLTLPLWFVLSWVGLGRLHPGVTVAQATTLRIADAVPVQVDGEWARNSAVTIAMDGPQQSVLVPKVAASAGRASSLPHSAA